MSNPTQLPSIYAGILFQARLNPYATAVVTDSGNVTYKAFAHHIELVTRRLDAQDVPDGARVAVVVESPYIHWLVVFALARLGAVSVSLSKGIPLALVQPDVVVMSRGAEHKAKKVIEVGDDWLQETGLPAFTDVLRDANTPCRIVLSSGTTGTPKLALFTLDHIRSRLRGISRTYGFVSASRMQNTMGISTIGGFTVPLSCWGNGAAVLIPMPRPTQHRVHFLRLKPNILFTSVAQLEGIVKELPPDHVTDEPLIVFVAGAELPRQLNRNARLRLSQSLFTIYGSTEAGTVAMAHAAACEARPGFAGHIVPIAQLEVVGEDGKPVAPGTSGEIRIRAEGMVDEYVDDRAGEDSPIRDGWFYPGDAGSVDEEGGLILFGRTRELINVGGIKLSPTVLEQALAGVPGIDDIAVFGLATGEGERVAAAVIPAPGAKPEQALLERFRKVAPKLPPLVVARVKSIPRNEMGKVQRLQLAESIKKAVERKKASG